jgi:hypothetical protein
MDLRGFTRLMVKQASWTESAEKAGRWLFTKKLKPKMFGSQAHQAKKVLDSVGSKLDKDTHDKLLWASKGSSDPSVDTKKIIRQVSDKHNLREASLAKPAIIGATAVGTVGGMRRGKKQRSEYPNLRLTDRSPHLTQDPSRVLYA